MAKKCSCGMKMDIREVIVEKDKETGRKTVTKTYVCPKCLNITTEVK